MHSQCFPSKEDKVKRDDIKDKLFLLWVAIKNAFWQSLGELNVQQWILLTTLVLCTLLNH